MIAALSTAMPAVELAYWQQTAIKTLVVMLALGHDGMDELVGDHSTQRTGEPGSFAGRATAVGNEVVSQSP